MTRLVCALAATVAVLLAATLEGRGNYVDGSHTPTRYGQELLPISEGWVPVWPVRCCGVGSHFVSTCPTKTSQRRRCHCVPC